MLHILNTISPYSTTEGRVSYQGYYDFAVRVGFEVIWVLEMFAQHSMVIDLAVDSKGQSAIVVD